MFLYQQRQKKEKKMDHVKKGKVFKHFLTPPKFPTNEEIGELRDGVILIIPAKLKELLQYLEKLTKDRKRKLRSIPRDTRTGTNEEWFLALLAEHEFAEAYIVQAWIRYWLDLWNKVSSKPLPSRIQIRLDRIDDYTKNKANQHSIRNLYPGQLRQSGSRLTGLCPFHEERTPSFFIFPNNTWFCFGACAVGGDAVAFIMELKGLTFPEAVRYLL